MVEWFERETEVKFVPTMYPDYHPDAPGGVDIGRSILAAPYNARKLGAEIGRLRPPLTTITFIGMMFNSSNADLKHFFNATRSLVSAAYVGKRLSEPLQGPRAVPPRRAGHQRQRAGGATRQDLLRPRHPDPHQRRSARAAESPTARSPVRSCAASTTTCASPRGAAWCSPAAAIRTTSSASRKTYPHLQRGGEHLSPVPTGNTGDGLKLAESVGGKVDIRFDGDGAAAWMPVSRVPLSGGKFGVFPHLLDRYKPGIIGVLRNGKRFTNESNSYHDVGAAMIAACKERERNGDVAGLRPGHDRQVRSRLREARADAARRADPQGLPVQGQHAGRAGHGPPASTLPDWRRPCASTTSAPRRAWTRSSGAARRRSTAISPTRTTSRTRASRRSGKGPYYAVKVIMGDLGTFDGIRTTTVGEVLKDDGDIVPGLYAVGNDRASIMGGNYPGAGITLGPNMTFGYITGRHIAARAGGRQPQTLRPQPVSGQARAEVRHAA